MKSYTFTITIRGYGDNKEEAWLDACEGIYEDKHFTNEVPEEFTIEEETIDND